MTHSPAPAGLGDFNQSYFQTSNSFTMQTSQIQANRPKLKVQRLVNLNAVSDQTNSTKSGFPCWLTVAEL